MTCVVLGNVTTRVILRHFIMPPVFSSRFMTATMLEIDCRDNPVTALSMTTDLSMQQAPQGARGIRKGV